MIPLTLTLKVLSTGESHIKPEHTWASYNEGETAPAEPAPAPDFPSRPGFLLPSGHTAHPMHYRIEDFPVLPFTHGAKKDTSAPSNPSPGEEQTENVWLHGKSKAPWTPPKYNAVPPPNSYDIVPRPSSEFKKPIPSPSPNSKIRLIEASSNLVSDKTLNATTTTGRIVDPDHPDYNAAVFHNHILEKYVCPYKACG